MTAFPWPRGEPATDWSAIDRSMGESSALARLWRGFMAARYCVAAILVILQGVMHAFGQTLQPAALVVAGGYLAATVLAARALPIRPPIRSLGLIWLSSIGVDLLAFASLQLLQGATINYSPLFALPVLMGAVLGTKIIGLGTTAAATLVLLAHAAWYGWIREGAESPRYVQAALTGTGLFVVALLAHELARRLTREEALAHRNRGTAQMHALVNDMVIETLAEGVLVIDEDGRVHAVNPAADAILGQGLASLPLPFKLNVRAAWIPLGALALRTFERRAPQSIEIPVAQSEGAAREVRVRTRLTPSGDSQPQSLCVMFLQDLRELEARIRTEKLAAMGRMSAAVAHEIRNPLAAIAQASALLSEDLVDPAHRQLTTMVQQNAQRLARIVDDVLDVARVRQQRALPLDAMVTLGPAARTIAEEWARQTGRQGLAIDLDADADSANVYFDVEHLRRILVNLLDNAARYAGDKDGSIRIANGRAADGKASLGVWSDGAPLEPAVQRHLFEPFFSSESRSSGLGLFLCRELCERHGASIGYGRRDDSQSGVEGNEFFITFASPESRLTQ